MSVIFSLRNAFHHSITLTVSCTDCDGTRGRRQVGTWRSSARLLGPCELCLIRSVSFYAVQVPGRCSPSARKGGGGAGAAGAAIQGSRWQGDSGSERLINPALIRCLLDGDHERQRRQWM